MRGKFCDGEQCKSIGGKTPVKSKITRLVSSVPEDGKYPGFLWTIFFRTKFLMYLVKAGFVAESCNLHTLLAFEIKVPIRWRRPSFQNGLAMIE